METEFLCDGFDRHVAGRELFRTLSLSHATEESRLVRAHLLLLGLHETSYSRDLLVDEYNWCVIWRFLVCCLGGCSKKLPVQKICSTAGRGAG